MNGHPHIHLSVTRGGLDKHKPIYFKTLQFSFPQRILPINLLPTKNNGLTHSGSEKLEV
ncbi:hypothetical protein ITG12_27410 (plasmid) [Vibrio sp. ED002]|nr:hypothetical protein ITG12_27410 [Vibrio sp. ED002]